MLRWRLSSANGAPAGIDAPSSNASSMSDPTNPQEPRSASADDATPSSQDWQVRLVEQRRQGREQELWSIPTISIAAQAFLFTTGLAPDTRPAARIIVAVIGLLTAVGTWLAVLRQGARVYIAEQWMEEIHNAPSVWALKEQLIANRKSRHEPENTSLIERVPRWISGLRGTVRFRAGTFGRLCSAPSPSLMCW